MAMTKTGATARWTVSTGASLVLMVAVALVAAPVVSAGPGDGGGGDPIAGLIGDGGPGFLGGGDHGGGGQAVHGRAMSRGETDSYGLGLQARGDGDKAHGRLFFGHRGDGGGEGFGGEITCLSVGDDGVVQVSGTTREGRGHRHGGRHGDGGGKKEGDPGDGGGKKEGEPGDAGGGKEGEPGAEPAPAGFGHGGGHHGGGHHGGDPGNDEGSKDGSGDEQMAGGKNFAFTILTKSDPQQFSLPKMGDDVTPCGGGDATTVAVTRGGFHAHK
jgi:hypothetical protein